MCAWRSPRAALRPMFVVVHASSHTAGGFDHEELLGDLKGIKSAPRNLNRPQARANLRIQYEHLTWGASDHSFAKNQAFAKIKQVYRKFETTGRIGGHPCQAAAAGGSATGQAGSITTARDIGNGADKFANYLDLALLHACGLPVNCLPICGDRLSARLDATSDLAAGMLKSLGWYPPRAQPHRGGGPQLCSHRFRLGFAVSPSLAFPRVGREAVRNLLRHSSRHPYRPMSRTRPGCRASLKPWQPPRPLGPLLWRPGRGRDGDAGPGSLLAPSPQARSDFQLVAGTLRREPSYGTAGWVGVATARCGSWSAPLRATCSGGSPCERCTVTLPGHSPRALRATRRRVEK